MTEPRIITETDIDGQPMSYHPCQAEALGLPACDHVPLSRTTHQGADILLCEMHGHQAAQGIPQGDSWAYYDVRDLVGVDAGVFPYAPAYPVALRPWTPETPWDSPRRPWHLKATAERYHALIARDGAVTARRLLLHAMREHLERTYPGGSRGTIETQLQLAANAVFVLRGDLVGSQVGVRGYARGEAWR